MLNKLPSISNIIINLKAACVRFPLAVITAFAGTIVGLFMVHNNDSEILPKLLMSLGLALPLFVSAVLFFEGRNTKKTIIIIINSVIVVFLTMYYFYLPDSLMGAEEMIFFRFVFWVAGFSLLVTFIKFVAGDERETGAFWQYNRHLFQGLALTALYALTIMFGLFIALSSVNYLFDLNIDGERYAEIWVVMAGLFSPLFFLSRLPRNLDSLIEDDNYPRELRLFAQFVLTPLVSLYFIILYAYVVRILITGEWPKGTLAYMIIGFSFAGVLTYFVLYPLRDKIRWVARGGQIFFIVLIPQVGMLFWSLWFRISEYGITEKRYLVFIFGLWLFAFALYILISKKKDIRLIPATIFIIILLASFGPWGAFAVSKASQTERLKDILIKNELFTGGKIVRIAEGGEVNFDDRKEISATVRYLYRTHGRRAVQPLFVEDIGNFKNDSKNISGDKDRYNYSYEMPKLIVEKGVGIRYVEQWEGVRIEGNNFNFYSRGLFLTSVFKISGFDFIYNITAFTGIIPGIAGGEYRYELNRDTGAFEIFKDNISIAKLELGSMINSLASGRTGLSREEYLWQEDDAIKAALENENISLEFYITNISGERAGDNGFELDNVQGYLLFSLKE